MHVLCYKLMVQLRKQCCERGRIVVVAVKMKSYRAALSLVHSLEEVRHISHGTLCKWKVRARALHGQNDSFLEHVTCMSRIRT